MFKVGDTVERTEGSWASVMADGSRLTVSTGDRVVVNKIVGRMGQAFSIAGQGGGSFDASKFKLVEELSLVPKETDPSGISLNTPGAKADAGKLRPSLVLGGFAKALEAVVLVGTKGAAKYTDNGWKEVPNGFARYSDAQGRHELKRNKGETHDADSGDLHLAHEAWNALAKLQLYLDGKA